MAANGGHTQGFFDETPIFGDGVDFQRRRAAFFGLLPGVQQEALYPGLDVKAFFVLEGCDVQRVGWPVVHPIHVGRLDGDRGAHDGEAIFRLCRKAFRPGGIEQPKPVVPVEIDFIAGEFLGSVGVGADDAVGSVIGVGMGVAAGSDGFAEVAVSFSGVEVPLHAASATIRIRLKRNRRRVFVISISCWLRTCKDRSGDVVPLRPFDDEDGLRAPRSARFHRPRQSRRRCRDTRRRFLCLPSSPWWYVEFPPQRRSAFLSTRSCS